MTSIDSARRRVSQVRRRRRSQPAARECLAGLLGHPLADYTLLLGATLALLGLGLVMVFSASSVESFADGGSIFSAVRQAGSSSRPSAFR